MELNITVFIILWIDGQILDDNDIFINKQVGKSI